MKRGVNIKADVCGSNKERTVSKVLLKQNGKTKKLRKKGKLQKRKRGTNRKQLMEQFFLEF